MKSLLLYCLSLIVLLALTGCTATDPYPDDAYFGDIYSHGVLLGAGGGDMFKATYDPANISEQLVGLVAVQELDNKTLDSSVGKGTWTNSGVWKLPAMFFNGDITTDRWLSEENNTILGVSAMGLGVLTHTGGAEGWHNTAIGHHTMASITTGSFNTALGAHSLIAITTGTGNTSIGTLAGYSLQTGAYNVFLGTLAGGLELGSNKLYIDNSDTATPLIYGDFSTNDLTVNGNLHITTGSLDMSQIGAEPASTADRAGIYAIDLSPANCTIGFNTETAVLNAVAIVSTNKIPIRWNGVTYYLLVTTVP